jgi:hypothetical protein
MESRNDLKQEVGSRKRKKVRRLAVRRRYIFIADYRRKEQKAYRMAQSAKSMKQITWGIEQWGA